MVQKKKKLMVIMLIILVAIMVLALVACSNKTNEEEEDDPTVNPGGKVATLNDYMRQVNAGLVASDNYLDGIKEYHVSNVYTIYTSVENYTITYDAIFAENEQDSKYYLRVFDNNNNIERLRLYYDSKDLYFTFEGESYKQENFGTLMLFGILSEAMNKMNLKELFFGDFMQEYFAEGSILSQFFSVNDCKKVEVDNSRTAITMANGDFDIIMSTINASISTIHGNIGTVFDTPSMYYLGFKLSSLLEYSLAAINISKIQFLLDKSSGTELLYQTEVNVNGRMMNGTKYFIDAKYSYDTKTTLIDAGAKYKNDTEIAFNTINLGQGTFDGTILLPTVRSDSGFNMTIDYDLNSVDNSTNEFTFRIYDQNNSNAGPGASKYADIDLLFGAFYSHEILYIDATGLYRYIGDSINLAYLNLPKIYLENIDLTSVMLIIYSDAIKLINALIFGSTNEQEEISKLNVSEDFYSMLIGSITSDVQNMTISIEITEDLIKALRNDTTPLAYVLGDMAGLTREQVRKFFGEDFLSLLKIYLEYDFIDKEFCIIGKYDDVDQVDMRFKSSEQNGIILPTDLNDNNYAELETPEVVTISLEGTVMAYNTSTTDLSQFMGAFIGEPSGINTPYSIGIGESLYVSGQLSVYDTTNTATGETKAMTTFDVYIYKRIGSQASSDKLLMHIITNPLDLDELLVDYYIAIGDYANPNGIKYKISREVVAEALDVIAGGDSILSNGSAMVVMASLYNKIGENINVYTDNGFYCISMVAKDDDDPVKDLIGIEGTYAIVKTKYNFIGLDLSSYNASDFDTPYINEIRDVSAESIYSANSKWKDNIVIYVDGKTINLKPEWSEESTQLETGKTIYNPTTNVFGQEVTYTLTIVDDNGTNVISQLDLDNNLLIIDPAYISKVPTTIDVIYDNYKTATIDCKIEGFYDANITAQGYNLALLSDEFVNGNAEFDGMKYKLHIGENSIAEVEFEIYIAVVNREVIPIQTTNLDGSVTDIYINQNIPVIASFSLDPYYYYMCKNNIENYDVIQEYITNELIKINFENQYGTKEVIDEITGETKEEPLKYNKEGYNWMYIKDLNLDWTFDETKISYGGNVLYAYGSYGNDDGEKVDVAIRVSLIAKVLDYIKVDNYENGTYIIDYLIKETYAVPTESNSLHTVRAYFKDGTYKIIDTARPSGVSEEDYYTNYIASSIDWAGIANIEEKITVSGTSVVFGTNESDATNVTTAQFGAINGNSQKASLTIIIPSREISTRYTKEITLVTSYDAIGENATVGQVSITKAMFAEPNDKRSEQESTSYSPYAINPYDMTARLPSTIWLYVSNDVVGSSYTWAEYKVNWRTTDKDGNELNIIKENDNGYYVLAHPVTVETQLVVYGTVGDGNGVIWVCMSILNLESSINSFTLYTNGVEYNPSTTITIDPYLSYEDLLPNEYNIILGSNQTITNMNDEHPYIVWYVTYEGKEYVLNRDDDSNYASSDYDSYYIENGYFVFNKSGGTYSIKMYIIADSIKNSIVIGVSVLTRTLMGMTDNNVFVSNYIDLFNTDKNGVGDHPRRTTYDVNLKADQNAQSIYGVLNPGYTNINYYEEDSERIAELLEEIIYNGGYQVVGVAFEETGLTVAYAKYIYWDVSQVSAILRALRNYSSTSRFTLTGLLDGGTINEVSISILFTIYYQNLAYVELIRSEIAISSDIYSVRNDLDATEDGATVLKVDDTSEDNRDGEMNKVITAGYHFSEQYNKYFNVTTGYDDSTYKYVIVFDLEKAFALKTSSNGTYVSPYDYFVYLFGNMRLRLDSGATNNVSTNINLNGVSKAYFNASVLGLNTSTQENDSKGTYSYSFLLLDKLSEGSALDSTLIVIIAKASTKVTDNETIDADAFDEFLVERYSSGYTLPTTINITYSTFDDDGMPYEYIVKYSSNEWFATSNYRAILGADALTSINYQNINIISGTTYTFTYELPETASIFTLIVNFNRKNIDKTLYSAEGSTSLYDIEKGVMNVSNPYLLFDYNAINDTFILDTSIIPTQINVSDVTGYFVVDNLTAYRVNWIFGIDNNTNGLIDGNEQATTLVFESSIIKEGLTRVLIGQVSFTSYYNNGEQVTQYIFLYLTTAKLTFYAIEGDGFNVVENENTGIKNVIVIDPYDETDAYDGRFILPTSMTIKFTTGVDVVEYKFSGISYKLMDTAATTNFNKIEYIDYNEAGHMLNYASFVEKANEVSIDMFIPGFGNATIQSEIGIVIYVQILSRLIKTVYLDNNKYDVNGNYIYSTDGNGDIEYESDGTPIIKTYNSYARYNFVDGNGENEATGSMPVYYVDPYNTTTYTLPQKATVEFYSDLGTRYTYTVAGWQYYDAALGEYVDFTEIEDSSQIADLPFYKLNSGSKWKYIYNLTNEDYKGSIKLIRGYIAVGSNKQYFEVLLVVLNRSLTLEELLNESYAMNYDFSDPIAALLSDIPTTFDSSMFVSYDYYYQSRKLTGLYNAISGVYSITIDEDQLFSQYDENSAPTNTAANPSILWEDTYIVNGNEVTFDSFIKTGYVGSIGGNIYGSGKDIGNLINYYSKAMSVKFDTLIKSLLWDGLFSNGVVSSAFSTTAASAISEYAQQLLTQQIFAAYKMTLANLNAVNKNYLEVDLLEGMLVMLNQQSTITGRTYSLSNETDYIDVVYALYSSLKEDYTSWQGAGSIAATKTNALSIYETWTSYLTTYQTSDTKTDIKAVTDNQKYKAYYYSLLVADSSNFTTAEQTRMANNYTTQKVGLTSYINAAIWDAVYERANIREKEYLDEIFSDYNIPSRTEIVNKSLSLDVLIARYSTNTNLGVIGEKTTANITMPIIQYSSIDVDNNTIIFSQVNFETIDSEFTINFVLDYKEVYKVAINDSKETILEEYREALAYETLQEYAQAFLEKGIDDVVPITGVDITTGEEIVLDMVQNGLLFGYEWLEQNVFSAANRNYVQYYKEFWDILNNYYTNLSLKYVLAQLEYASTYTEAKNLTEMSESEWTAIINIYVDLNGLEPSIYGNTYRELVRINEALNNGTITRRIDAFYALIDFIVENDPILVELNGYYTEAQNAFYIDLASELLLSDSTKLAPAYGKLNSDTKYAAAQLFNLTYKDLGYGITDEDWSLILYNLVREVVGNGISEFNSIQNNEALASLGEKFYMCYISNTEELKATAEFFYEFILGYILSDTTPFDLFLEKTDILFKTSISSDGLLKDLIYATDSTGELVDTCLLAQVVLDETYTTYMNALTTVFNNNLIHVNNLELLVKEYLLLEKIINVYGMGSTQQITIRECKATAKEEIYILAMERLMATLSTNHVDCYNEIINSFEAATSTKGFNAIKANAFEVLVAKYTNNGNLVTNIYDNYKEEYIKNNDYTKSKEILDTLAYNYNRLQTSTTLLSSQYILNEIYGRYIQWYYEEYVSLNANDDITNDDMTLMLNNASGALLSAADELRERYYLTNTTSSDVKNLYLEDYLLRALVYFYNNIATNSQKLIIIEVLRMSIPDIRVYTESNLSEFSIEREILANINKNALLSGTGLVLYNELEARYDLGNSYKKLFKDSYFTVLLSDILFFIEYYINDGEMDSIITGDAIYADEVGHLGYKDLYQTINPLSTELDNIALKMARYNIYALSMQVGDAYDSVYATETAELNEDAYLYAYNKLYDLRYSVVSSMPEDATAGDYYLYAGTGNIYTIGAVYYYTGTEYIKINTPKERTGYVYRDELTKHLNSLLNNKYNYNYYESLYYELEKQFINDEIGILNLAVNKAIEVMLYSSIYDEIRLLSLTPEEFAERIYYYLTGETGTAEDLLGASLDGAEGLLADMLTWSTEDIYSAYLNKLTDWWTNTIPVYGDSQLSVAEQDFISEISNQVGYRNNRNVNLVKTQTIIYIYQFLVDLEEYKESTMPADYRNPDNEREYKWFVVNSLINSEVMTNSAHSVTLAKAFIDSYALSSIKELATRFDAASGAISINANETYSYSDYIDFINKALTEGICSDDGFSTTYSEYLDKAIEYVEYTSVASDDTYINSVGTNKLFAYISRVYLNKIGHNIGANAIDGYSLNENENVFGQLTLNWYLNKAKETCGVTFTATSSFASGNTPGYYLFTGATGEYINGTVYKLEGGNYIVQFSLYQTAIDLLINRQRIVSQVFYSEDYVDNDEDGRHIIYFDRTEWEEFVENEDEEKGTAQGNIANSDIYITNANKTTKVETNEGYSYTNSFSANNITFKITNANVVRLYFNYVSNSNKGLYNTIHIDALAPELPTSVYAIGYTGSVVSEENSYVLGYVKITGYSESFYELIFDNVIKTEDSAYYVNILGEDNNIIKVVIDVIYQDRSIDYMYVDTGDYSENPNKIIDNTSPFVDMYRLYSDDQATNVIYIDPLNVNTLNANKNGYILPTTLGVQYGDGTQTIISNVEWVESDITFNIKGTSGEYKVLNIATYTYTDTKRNTRKIEFNYSTKVVTISILNELGLAISSEEYTFESAPQWNLKVYIEDRTVQQIYFYNGTSYETLGSINGFGRIDATQSGYNINQFYPEYPTQLRVYFKDGDSNISNIITLSNSDWALGSSQTALRTIIQNRQTEGKFDAVFKYLGYNISVEFKTKSIQLPTVTNGELSTYIQGGTLYAIIGGESIYNQIVKHYSVMYFNFGTEEEPNWQKVPVAFDSSSFSTTTAQNPATLQVTGFLGYTSTNSIDGGYNIVFTVKVIDPNAYAVLNNSENPFVTFDYYIAARDSAGNKRTTADEPNTNGDTYLLLTKVNGVYEVTETFNVLQGDIKYDFVNNLVTIPMTYILENADSRLAADAYGTRERLISLTMPLRSYVYTNITNPQFITTKTGAKWTWTTESTSSVNYVDAIYWPLGEEMTASDLPTVRDAETGVEISLMWDLTNLNVNLANATENEKVGTTIYGYYMSANGAWRSIPLVVYIEQEEVTRRIIASVTGNGDIYTINKTYDAHYYQLPFDASTITYLRSDGTYAALDESKYTIEYMNISVDDPVWSSTAYPMDAGTYYIRIVFTDYNVYVSYPEDDSYLFRFVINPMVVKVNEIGFVGENESRIEYTYSSTSTYLIVEQGLPSVTADNWFTAGEKAHLVSKYVTLGYTQTNARALAYMEIYNRVAPRVQEILAGYYDELLSSGMTNDAAIKESIYTYRMPETEFVYQETDIVATYKQSGQDVPYPSDVGIYSVTIDIDTVNGNYRTTGAKTITLIISKDESLSYTVSSTLPYNGEAQNPIIEQLNPVPKGVKITYTYEMTDDGAQLIIINNGGTLSISPDSTYETSLLGIKDFRQGGYQYTITIEGGNNFIDGVLGGTVTITKSNVYVDLENIVGYYLDDIVNINDYIRIYTDANPTTSSTKLYGLDTINDLGALITYSDVQSYYPVGEYYMSILGLALTANATTTYTKALDPSIGRRFNSKWFSLLQLKPANEDGSILKYKEADGSYTYNALYTLFNNYNIYVKYDSELGTSGGAAATYTITTVDGAIGVSTNQELQEIISNLSNGDDIVLYLEPLVNNEAYSAIEINVDASVKLVGYYDTSTKEINTVIQGIKLLRGALIMQIISVQNTNTDTVGLLIGDNANTVKIYNCEFVGKESYTSTVGISTTKNYASSIYLFETEFEYLSTGVYMLNGGLEMERCTLYNNYNGIDFIPSSESLNIYNSTFIENTNGVRTMNKDSILRYNIFARNELAILISELTNIEIQVVNEFESNIINIKEGE